MISDSTFNISIKEGIIFLKECNLFKDIGPKKGSEYSSEFKKTSRKNNHIEIYNAIRENLDYEIVLFDDSFFQFSIGDDFLRYSFIQNPSFSYTKLDYLKIFFPDSDLANQSLEEIDSLVNENEYEQFLNELEMKSNLIYIRYDLDKKGYKPLLHSYSHIHVGLSDNFRIPCSIVLTPLEFVLFSIKQCYYAEWRFYHESRTFAELVTKRKKSKNSCHPITEELLWNKDEENEIYIK